LVLGCPVAFLGLLPRTLSSGDGAGELAFMSKARSAIVCPAESLVESGRRGTIRGTREPEAMGRKVVGIDSDQAQAGFSCLIANEFSQLASPARLSLLDHLQKILFNDKPG
jgi:hypothetical protein